jgi:protein-S-isoprenylcysteine O-methyltransferase Ste14
MGVRSITRARAFDIAGFAFFALSSSTLVLRAPQLGLLLVPVIGKELFTAFTFLIREQPRAAVATFQARFAAYAGTFVIMALFHALRTWDPESLTTNEETAIAALGAIVWLAGTLLVCTAMWSLRYAFSIEPQARRVVRTGPYEFVRHPVYAAYVLQNAGIWLIYPSIALAAGLAVWFALTLVRMHFEEGILTRTFPEYESYRRATGRLFPTQLVFHRRPEGTVSL